jgi:drug/metabolite transporter (DMT)-like permease
MISSALYKTVNRKASAEFTPYERTFLVLAVSAIVFNISGLSAVKWDMAAYVAPLVQPRYVLSVLCLSLLCSIAANILVNYATGQMSVFKVSSFGSLSTLCAAFAGIVWPMNVPPITGGMIFIFVK